MDLGAKQSEKNRIQINLNLNKTHIKSNKTS